MNTPIKPLRTWSHSLLEETADPDSANGFSRDAGGHDQCLRLSLRALVGIKRKGGGADAVQGLEGGW